MSPELDVQLDQLVARGRAAWPELDVADVVLRDHLRAKLDGLPDSAGLQAEDLYLACACAAGNTTAIDTFDVRYLAQVKVFLGRMKPSTALVDEVKQVLRVRLLVAAPGAVPRIADYGGRGTLVSWLRVAAIRLAIDLLRESGDVRSAPSDDEPMLGQVGADDPELATIKERYRAEVSEAMRDAFSLLSPTQRNLLRLSYRDNRSIDEIGTLLSAHRSTVARWIADARETILDGARQKLQKRLALTPSEAESLLRLLRSQLHLSVTRLLS